MMLYPAISELIEITSSGYLLVNATAKRARQIAEEAQRDGEILDEKPVKIAINEIYEGRVTLLPIATEE